MGTHMSDKCPTEVCKQNSAVVPLVQETLSPHQIQPHGSWKGCLMANQVLAHNQRYSQGYREAGNSDPATNVFRLQQIFDTNGFCI